MATITEKAWEVFRSTFKDGEDVVVETSWGAFHHGKLKAERYQVVISPLKGITRCVDWDDIEFMAHDGFPVSKLMGMTPEEAAERASCSSVEVVEQLFLWKEPQKRSVSKEFIPTPFIPRRYFGGGCPFVAGPCQLIGVHNRGNTGRRFWYRDDGEVLIFQAADGARMHTYDSDHLFMLS